MDATLGQATVLASTVCALAAVVLFGVATRRRQVSLVRQARSLLVVSVVAIVAAGVVMEHAFVSHDFSLSYVAANNSLETPLLFSITGMWSALQGSLLLWAIVLGGYVAAMVRVTRRLDTSWTATYALFIASVVYLFFLVLLAGPATPFATASHVVADGQGPNPLLQQYPLVAVHPPFLYLGFVGMTVPFAFASASLISREDSNLWLERTRRWSIIAWICLTIGITLGAWWSYQVLGWGGFWAWDPVENAAFLPWLCATAYLHSTLSQQRRKTLSVWNYALVSSGFALTILGTYFTRSGVVQSVHAFSDSSLGTLLIVFFGAVVVFVVGIVVARADDLRAGRKLAVGVNRETVMAINNVLFGAFALVVLLGTSFPLLVQATSGSAVTVGTPYFNSFAIPLGLLLMIFLGIGPLVGWRAMQFSRLADRLLLPAVVGAAICVGAVVAGEHRLYVIVTYAVAGFALGATIEGLRGSSRTREGSTVQRLLRTGGGALAHLGVLVIAMGMVSATAFGHQGELHLRPGQSATFNGERLTYLGAQNVVTPSRSSYEANVLVNGAGPYHPAISQYGTYTEAVGMPAVAVRWTYDVYLTIDATPTSKAADAPLAIGIIIQPLISWLWVGAAMVAMGGLWSAYVPLLRRRRRGRQDVALPEETPVAVGGGE